jgi:hypothetical protein
MIHKTEYGKSGQIKQEDSLSNREECVNAWHGKSYMTEYKSLHKPSKAVGLSLIYKQQQQTSNTYSYKITNSNIMNRLRPSPYASHSSSFFII